MKFKAMVYVQGGRWEWIEQEVEAESAEKAADFLHDNINDVKKVRVVLKEKEYDYE